MKTTKPTPQRVYVIVRDAITGKSKTFTVYEARFDEILVWLERVLEEAVESPSGGPTAEVKP